MVDLKLVRLVMAVASLSVYSSSGLASGQRADLAGKGASLAVLVIDRSSDAPLSSASVVVLQGKKQVGNGTTGANGVATVDNLLAGDSVVNCEKEYYLAKPEVLPTTLKAGGNKVTMTLLRPTEGAEYYRRAARNIDRDAQLLPEDQRNAHYLREWERIKLLRPEYQSIMAAELKGVVYLVSDPRFKSLIKG